MVKQALQEKEGIQVRTRTRRATHVCTAVAPVDTMRNVIVRRDRVYAVIPRHTQPTSLGAGDKPAFPGSYTCLGGFTPGRFTVRSTVERMQQRANDCAPLCFL